MISYALPFNMHTKQLELISFYITVLLRLSFIITNQSVSNLVFFFLLHFFYVFIRCLTEQ